MIDSPLTVLSSQKILALGGVFAYQYQPISNFYACSHNIKDLDIVGNMMGIVSLAGH